jgi:hypothetical protein
VHDPLKIRSQSIEQNLISFILLLIFYAFARSNVFPSNKMSFPTSWKLFSMSYRKGTMTLSMPM